MTAQITDPTPTTADQPRSLYEAARALADRIVAQLTVLPDSVEAHREFGANHFGVRLHFGTGLAAGRGVLETAALADAEVTREDSTHAGQITGVWIELHTSLDGIPLIARALTSTEDADQLLLADDAETTQPIPTPATAPVPPTSPASVFPPAVSVVVPLATLAQDAAAVPVVAEADQ
ncbi:hypothetical protein [Streptomyces griseosporeus]|uniref:hypothetical protein n=1 Tax=Streptomyces griseosporeus TaxID=1910 RepID=UPI0036F4BE88